MKKAIMILVGVAIYINACSQSDKTFKEVVTFEKGFQFTLSGPLQTIPFTGSGGVADWNTMINKPGTFPPSAHNHDLLYKPISYKPDWSEVQNKPTETPLATALGGLTYTPLVSKTTTEINALVIPSGVIAMVWDKTLKVLKVWDGTKWKTVITNN